MKTKTLTTIIFAALVTGCSAMPQYYDNNEYELLARIETTTRLIQENCGDSTKVMNFVPTLVEDSELLDTYTQFVPRDEEAHKIAHILKGDARELESQYKKGTDNPTYCKLKTEALLVKVRSALTAVAKEKRI